MFESNIDSNSELVSNKSQRDYMFIVPLHFGVFEGSVTNIYIRAATSFKLVFYYKLHLCRLQFVQRKPT
jgi:hypothetical protein